MRGGGFEGGAGVGIGPDSSRCLPLVSAPTGLDRACARVVKVSPTIVFILIILVASGDKRIGAVIGDTGRAEKDAIVAIRRD